MNHLIEGILLFVFQFFAIILETVRDGVSCAARMTDSVCLWIRDRLQNALDWLDRNFGHVMGFSEAPVTWSLVVGVIIVLFIATLPFMVWCRKRGILNGYPTPQIHRTYEPAHPNPTRYNRENFREDLYTMISLSDLARSNSEKVNWKEDGF